MSLDLPSTIEDVVELLELIPHPEGGFFRETYRSGAVPMASRGQTDFDVDPQHLVATSGREGLREDSRRNALTSIYWMPTRRSPYMPLVLNQSSHVHYYHGGLPFRYVMYDPEGQTVTEAVLGPNLRAGHRPQVIVEGGVWKTGRLLTDYTDAYDYCMLGEAVAPGFDVCDFRPMAGDEFDRIPPEVRGLLEPYFNSETPLSATTPTSVAQDFDSHYDDDEEKRTARVKERL
jgi:predicted cupin superfamily sugar epimerase